MKHANQTAFLKEFEQMTGDSVQSMVMARLYSGKAAIQRAGLELPPGQTFLWGLLIFGKQDIHFYVHSSQNSILALFHADSQTKTQHIRIARETLTRIAAPEPAKNKFFAVFSSKQKTAAVTFTAQDAKPVTLEFEVLLNNNEDITECLKTYGV